MKKQILFSILMIVIATSLSAQKIPSVDLKTINGKTCNTSSIITNKGKPIVISFWATWCKPCIKELSAFHDNYIDWPEETD